ncbi:MAG: hypothetical protein ABIO25_09615 [Specibacter sp.]
MVIRVVVGAVSVAVIMADRQEIGRSAASTVSAGEALAVDIVLVATMALGALGVMVYLLLAFLIFRGSNGARIAAMAYSALLVVPTAVAFFGGEAVTLSINIFGLPLDILVLLALSARTSRLWARR